MLSGKQELGMPNVDDFRNELAAQIDRATKQGRAHIEVNAGELHRKVGGYPPKGGDSHSMPSCCGAMRDEMVRGHAEIIHQIDSENAPAFTIRYEIPRPI
jgi:5-methylcytosine-specific restriction protein A